MTMFQPGHTIDGKYRITRHLGEGGMGIVYEGQNVRIGRRVAIKVLHAQVAQMPEFVERFEREALAAGRIGSPHVCDVLDLGDLPNGERFIVMEYLDGENLESRLEHKGRLTVAELAPIAFELLEGLGTMHAAGVIHRDLKPANVFLARTTGGRGEKVKILDFGVAKLQPLGGEVGPMTQTGAMMGTPLYMSPEQARGARDVDARTDLYSASVMFYRALAGVLPYAAQSLNELLFKIVLEDPQPLREIAPDVDPEFAAIVHHGLARDPAQRITSARAYQEEIAAWAKAQGHSNLPFAATLSRDPSGGHPVSVGSPGPGVPGGTPTSWSDHKPNLSSARLQAATPSGGHGTARSPGYSQPGLAAATPAPVGSSTAAMTPARIPLSAAGGISHPTPGSFAPSGAAGIAGPPGDAGVSGAGLTPAGPGPGRTPSGASGLTPSAPRSRGGRSVALVAVAAMLVGGVALFAWKRSTSEARGLVAPPPSAVPSAMATSIETAPSPAPNPVESVALPSPETGPRETPPAPRAAKHLDRPPPGHPSAAIVEPSATPSPSQAPAPSPSATSSSHGRKFRTTID